MDEQSPCLSEYESEGFLSRRKANSKQALAKMRIFHQAKPMTITSNNNCDDRDVVVSKAVSKRQNAKMGNVKRAKTMSGKSTNSSDDEDDVVMLYLFLH
jgi:hypothetical protein